MLDLVKKEENNDFFELLITIFERRENDHEKYPHRIYIMNQIDMYSKFYLSRDMSHLFFNKNSSAITKNFFENHIEPLIEEVEFINGRRNTIKFYLKEIEILLQEGNIQYEKDKLINNMFPVSFYIPKMKKVLRIIGIEHKINGTSGKLLGIIEFENKILKEVTELEVILIDTEELQKVGEDAEKVEEIGEMRKMFLLNKINQ